jgi:hypothetical protein
MNNSLRYLHTTWWNHTYTYTTATATASDGTTEAIEIAVPQGGFAYREQPIRGQGMAMYATALALKSNTFDVKRVGISRAEAQRRVVAWTNALTNSYDADSWGSTWQSPLWVYYLAAGAKQDWNALPRTTRAQITTNVTAEANHLLTETPGFYRDSTGTIVYPGNSQAEEDGWAGTLLLFAAREFPGDPNAAAWESKGRWFALASYSSPKQVGTDPRLTGSNVNPDGTVTNHGILHPDYMLTQAEYIAKVRLISAQTGAVVPAESSNNLRLVWRALVLQKFSARQYRWPGGTIYRRDKRGRPIPWVYYPQGDDWGTRRRFNAAQMDVEAFADRVSTQAYAYGRVHMLYNLQLQKRHGDGHIFSPGETRFPEEEQFAAASEAEMTYRLGMMR